MMMTWRFILSLKQLCSWKQYNIYTHNADIRLEVEIP